MSVTIFSERDLGAELVAPTPVQWPWNGPLDDYFSI